MSDFNLQAKGLFGRYCKIEMFRYGVPNEFFIHKIVSQSRRNTYCDVPLRWDSKPVGHPAKEGASFPDNLEEVIWVVQCGIDETKVFPVALKDVEVLGEDFNTGCEFQEIGSDGYPFCASATEIVRLQQELAIRQESEQEKVIEYMRQESADWEDKYRALVAENAKLRELAKAVREFTEGIRCDDCPMARDCEDNNMIACHEKLSYHAFCGLRELRIEVD